MKLKFDTGTTAKGRCVFRCRAVIEKSVKVGIPRRYKKTWSVYDADKICEKETRPLFIAEANRWRAKVMKQIFGDRVPELVQTEIE